MPKNVHIDSCLLSDSVHALLIIDLTFLTALWGRTLSKNLLLCLFLQRSNNIDLLVLNSIKYKLKWGTNDTFWNMIWYTNWIWLYLCICIRYCDDIWLLFKQICCQFRIYYCFCHWICTIISTIKSNAYAFVAIIFTILNLIYK